MRASLLFVAVIARPAVAIPSYGTGHGYVGHPDGPSARMLDPFIPGQGFDIINSTQCAIRFQSSAKSKDWRPGKMSPEQSNSLLDLGKLLSFA